MEGIRIILLLSQLVYVYYLFSNDAELVVTAANLGSHFILNNFFVAAFILLWVHGCLWIAEAVLFLNFVNLKSLYLRHGDMPVSAHWAVIAGPQIWNFVALFTNGAAMVNATDLPSRIVANVFIWSILFYGLYFILLRRDYISGLALSFLTLGWLKAGLPVADHADGKSSSGSATILNPGIFTSDMLRICHSGDSCVACQCPHSELVSGEKA